MKLTVKSLDNKVVKELEVPDAVFGYPFKEHLVHTAVQSYLNARRSGTAKTKPRGEVVGSNRKPYRQKGTGRARAGSAKSPLWRSGGTVHGPQPRSYADKLTPREKRNALKSVLSRRLKEEGLLVVDKLELESVKTGAFEKVLLALGVAGKTLLVDDYGNDRLALAARNNPRLKAVDAMGVNVYDVVDRPRLVVSEQALGRLVEVLSK
ncbi:MAG: 50S ribosomal protein L4 [Acidobacteriota bacterium]|nr:50S ribosomal protein L4 [Acidobacteriota bacterium]